MQRTTPYLSFWQIRYHKLMPFFICLFLFPLFFLLLRLFLIGFSRPIFYLLHFFPLIKQISFLQLSFLQLSFLQANSLFWDSTLFNEFIWYLKNLIIFSFILHIPISFYFCLEGCIVVLCLLRIGISSFGLGFKLLILTMGNSYPENLLLWFGRCLMDINFVKIIFFLNCTCAIIRSMPPFFPHHSFSFIFRCKFFQILNDPFTLI